MNAMTPAKIANVVAHTGMSEARARDLVTGKVRLHYRIKTRSHCSVRFALEVASNVHHEGEPNQDCVCADCRAEGAPPLARAESA